MRRRSPVSIPQASPKAALHCCTAEGGGSFVAPLGQTLSAARWFRLPVSEVDQVICEMVSVRQLRRVWVNISGDFWNDEEVFDLWD